MKVVLSGLLAVYWPILMALSLFFAVWTAKGPVPFNECKHRLNGLVSTQGPLEPLEALEPAIVDQRPCCHPLPMLSLIYIFSFSGWLLILTDIGRNVLEVS